MQVPPCPPDALDMALGVCSCPGEQRAEHTVSPSGLLVFPLCYPIPMKLGLVREEQQAARSGSWPQGPADASHEGCACGWGWHHSHASHTSRGPPLWHPVPPRLEKETSHNRATFSPSLCDFRAICSPQPPPAPPALLHICKHRSQVFHMCKQNHLPLVLTHNS